jgi:anti-anti-sigma factor
MFAVEACGSVFIGKLEEIPRLDATNAALFGETLAGYCTQHPGSHLLLDLHEVEYLSSAIITEIIRASRALQDQGGELRVCGLNSYVADVFQVTNLNQVFHVVKDVRQAADEFNRDLGESG